ncbi:MAG: DinB family protein [Spirosomataceae bacterium]
MDKTQLTDLLTSAVSQVVATAQEASSEHFFARPDQDVWSAAENVQHLIQSVQPVAYLMTKPKEYLVEKWGTVNWPLRAYAEVVKKYEAVLEQGLKATGNFIPVIDTNPDKAVVVAQFQQSNAQLLNIMNNQWTEQELDTYIIPHPVMGKMSVREMLYFTAFHTSHHHKSMQQRLAAVSQE